MLNYTHTEPEKQQVEHAISNTERILDAINETIREADGFERLGILSQDLYVGQGQVISANPSHQAPDLLL